jgi:hypothetical protein
MPSWCFAGNSDRSPTCEGGGGLLARDYLFQLTARLPERAVLHRRGAMFLTRPEVGHHLLVIHLGQGAQEREAEAVRGRFEPSPLSDMFVDPTRGSLLTSG